MAKQSNRPFVPCGSFELKRDAVASAKKITEESNQKWIAVDKNQRSNRWAIQRVE